MSDLRILTCLREIFRKMPKVFLLYIFIIQNLGVMDIWWAENLMSFSNGHLVGWSFQPTKCPSHRNLT